MSASPNPPTFESVWEEFTNKVRPYSSLQKKQILHETRLALHAVLNGMPAPRKDGSDESQSAPSGSSRRMLAEVETLIYDRMNQVNEDHSLWLRFDHKSTGSVSTPQFVASIASIGITLTDEEAAALQSKFPSATIEGGVCWKDMWKYLQATAELPRSTNQAAFSKALLARPNSSGSHFARLLANLQPDSVEERMTRGLKVMREAMYQKSSNFHSLFLSLQNPQTKMVAVDDLLPVLGKLGFPPNLCSEDELREVAERAAVKTPGALSYAEFLSFCTGHSVVPGAAGSGGAGANDGSLSATASGPLDSPALMNALVKINNINLRKFFKECDEDGDGLLTTEQLAKGLVDHGGLHASQAREPALLAYINTFAKKKEGHLGYACFIKFVSTRIAGNTGPINGQPSVHASAATRIPDDATPSQMLELVIRSMRSSNVSVESMMSQFDSDMDGLLDASEFFQGLCSLGLVLTQAQSQLLFDAVDTDHSGAIDIAEFAQLIVNPNKNPRLSTRVRHAPGGASSVPMGSYAPPAVESPHTGRASVTGPRQHLDLATSQTPLSASEQTPSRTSIKFEKRPSTIDLSFQPSNLSAEFGPAGSASPSSATPRSPAVNYDDQPQSGRLGRNPPGGRSVIDFGGDHGATAPRPQQSNKNKNSDAEFLHFDPTHPVAAARPRTATGRPAQISLSDEPCEAPASTPLKIRPAQSPATSKVSFNQSDSDALHTGRRVLASPGGNATFSFNDEGPPPSPSPVAPNFRPQDSRLDLSFDPSASPPSGSESARRQRGGGVTPTSSKLTLSHSSTRDDSDLTEGANHMTNHRTRAHVQGVASSVALGSDQGHALLETYKSEPVEIDQAVVQALSAAIYAHSQRLRSTFTEFNKNSNSSTLSKANFVAGVRSLKVDLSDAQADALFARFDSDGDDEISYSEWVRLLAAK